MNRGFPTIETLGDGRRRWTWRVTSQHRPSVGAEVLAAMLRDEVMTEWRRNAARIVSELNAESRTEVKVTSLSGDLFELAVIAPTEPVEWGMGCVFGAMQAFDRLARPVTEGQGRPRAGCPPWFLASEHQRPGPSPDRYPDYDPRAPACDTRVALSTRGGSPL